MKRVYKVPSWNERDFGYEHNLRITVNYFLKGLKLALEDSPTIKKAKTLPSHGKGAWIFNVGIDIDDTELEKRVDRIMHEDFIALTPEEYDSMPYNELKDHIYSAQVLCQKPFPTGWLERRMLMRALRDDPKLIYKFTNIPDDVDVKAIKKRIK